MGSINFNNYKSDTYVHQGYTYADLSLDLGQEPFEMYIGSRVIKSVGKDIEISYDLNAIKNSIVNLFNTTPGYRLLLPDYGCDLRQFVFEPISESTAYRIGRTIRTNIEKWEPRIILDNIGIDAYEDENKYEILLKIIVPLFSGQQNRIIIPALLDRQGFTLT